MKIEQREHVVYYEPGCGIQRPKRLFLVGSSKEMESWKSIGIGTKRPMHVLPLGAIDDFNTRKVTNGEPILSIWVPEWKDVCTENDVRPSIADRPGIRWVPNRRMDQSKLVAAICVGQELEEALEGLIGKVPGYAKYTELYPSEQKDFKKACKLVERAVSRSAVLTRIGDIGDISTHLYQASRNFVGIDTPTFMISGLNEEPLVE